MSASPLPIAIGEDNFRFLRENEAYFIDKSPLIRVVAQSQAKVTLITRPRRMGKSLNLSMLRYFFSCTEENTAPLFENLAIAEDSEVMAQQGRFPVIYLSLKGIRALDWEDANSQMAFDISRIASDHSYLLDSSSLPASEKAQLQAIVSSKGNGDGNLHQHALAVLSKALHTHHGKPVILLIDEYDAPIQRAYQNGFYKQMVAFMHRFLDVLKTSDHLHKAVLTGCLRIAKESLFSTLNNFVVHTVQDPSAYDQYFGFTQEEVDQILHDAKMSEHRQIVEQWYDGYQFGETRIYNPWSVLNYVAEGGREPKPYWRNTSEDVLLHQRLEEAQFGLHGDLEALLEGEAIEREVRDSITFRELGQMKEDVWSLLVHTGYLNAEMLEASDFGHYCRLRLPNYEVGGAFAGFIRYLVPEFDYVLQRRIFHALRDGDCETLGASLTEMVQFLSYHDKVAKQPEAAFHAFVLGLIAFGRSTYEIDSNPESGTGRTDILLRPRRPGPEFPGIVIEFKSLKTDDDVEQALTSALRQIEERNYKQALEKAGVEQIKRYAVVLREKQVTARMG